MRGRVAEIAKERPTIVVGVDGSDCSTRALAWAASYAEVTGADLRMVTVWRWPTVRGQGEDFGGWSPQRDAAEVLAEASATLSLPADRIATRLVEGSPGTVLAAEAADCALLVVGSRGARRDRRHALGSVALHCLEQADSPVTVVR